mmetsp:Transcript_43848/g.81886  ORF Transcript_43848/g.81886 Transcript_43848/m.81886 type:complete len:365 (+) Transcript_43848:56-1150(+)
MAVSALTLPLRAVGEGSDNKVVIKKTFLEVEEDITPKGLPATYNSDSVVWARFARQISGGSCDEEDYKGPDVGAEAEDGSEISLPKLLGSSPVSGNDEKDPTRPSEICLAKELANNSIHTVSTSDEKESTSTSSSSSPCGHDVRPALGPVPSPQALDEATIQAMSAAAAAMDAAGISRQSLDHLLNHLATTAPAPAPQPVQLLPALPDPLHTPRTTVMLRNLPNNYTRSMVCTMMDKEGFKGQYDFLYLPIDFRSKANLGYAFVNLAHENKVQEFWQTFDNYTKWVLPSAKVCSVSWSGPHQGQLAHIERYRDSPIMHGSVPDEFKPAIFAEGTGVRLDFPAPSKKLRAPRKRLPGAEKAEKAS